MEVFRLFDILIKRYSYNILYLFLITVRIIVLSTLISKLITLVQHPKVLGLIDDVTTLKFSSLLIFGIAIEIALLLFLMLPVKQYVKILAVLYFSFIIGAYRIVSYMVGQTWCPCVGNLVSWAPVTQDQINVILDIIVLYLLTGTLLSLVLIARTRPKFNGI